jgi:hypothetical protein
MTKEKFYEKYFNADQLDSLDDMLAYVKISQERIMKDAEGIDDELVKEIVGLAKLASAVSAESAAVYAKIRDAVEVNW